MIVSMTAFGRKEASGEWGNVFMEIKTVNHRYLDISIRIPDDFRILEAGIRDRISSRIKRGKVDCSLRIEPGEQALSKIPVNIELVEKIVAAARSLPISENDQMNPLDIMRWPGVIQKEMFDIDTIQDPVYSLVDATLGSIIETREREGAKIRDMILERCDAVSNQIINIKSKLPEIAEDIRTRYFKKAKDMQVELNNERFEQELLLLLQKMDISEELDRLEAHLKEVIHVVDQNEPMGRRLDFLMQEFNREANTLGSKSINIDMSNTSIELKVLIEQMREQIQNIE